MKQKRAFHKDKINSHQQLVQKKQDELELLTLDKESHLQSSNNEEIKDTFKTVVLPKKRKIEDLYKKNKRQKIRDDNYIPYAPTDQHTEEG